MSHRPSHYRRSERRSLFWFLKRKDKTGAVPTSSEVRKGTDGVDPLSLLDAIQLERQAPVVDSESRSVEELVFQLKGIHHRPTDGPAAAAG